MKLLKTFELYNPDGLTLTLSLPQHDIPEFCQMAGGQSHHVRVISDESYCNEDLRNYPGWESQQVCKLMSWRAMDVDHYIVLDSDCYLIRNVLAEDIQPKGGKPYSACGSMLRTVLKPDNMALLQYLRGEIPGSAFLLQSPGKVTANLEAFEQYRRSGHAPSGDAIARSAIPFKAFGRSTWAFFQPGQIFSGALLERLCGYFEHHGLTPGDAIRISPWEYNWYGEYAAAHHYDETDFRISPFLHFQTNADVDYARCNGITADYLSSRFWIIAMAARHVDAQAL